MLEYLNHITLNTGHCRKSYPSEISKDIYFTIRNLLKDSLKDYTEVVEGYVIKSTESNVGCLTTIYKFDKDEYIPLLTSAFSASDTGELWEALHETASMPLVTKSTDDIPVPYIADRIEAGLAFYPDVTEWSGDFSRCMGWVYLSPEQIR